jgi:rhodanese-related sulfurtransferase
MHPYQEIEAAELATLLNDKNLVLVDVRNDDEVAQGYIQGAIHIPLAAIPSNYESLLKAEKLVFYCHSGIRSAHAAAFLAQHDYDGGYNLIGGIVAWLKAGLPIVKK